MAKIELAYTQAIYTDGGCHNNPGPGAWAYVVVVDGKEQSHGTGFFPETTNNRMELLAVISGLRATTGAIDIVTDSQYVKQGMTSWIHGWKKKNWRTASGSPVKNRELWETLDSLCGSREVAWHWVRGHQGDTFNERADELTQIAIADGEQA